jgi:hypothetical protein
MRFNQWFKLNQQWVDIGRKVMIGKHECMLYWDAEKRHWRVEIENHGNIGRSQLSADDAIIDAKTTLGVVKEDITIPINVGDVVLGGKFKNKKITVKNIGKNEKGDITINGKSLLRFRIIPQDIEENYIVKSGRSKDFLLSRERGLTRKNTSGFANTLDNYYDSLDPRNIKTRERKPGKWLQMNKRIAG